MADDKPHTDVPAAMKHAEELAPDSGDLESEVMRARLKTRLLGADDEPQRVGQYALVRRLGEGGQGSVWAAYDEKLDRRVAIKLLHAHGEDQAQAEARLLREARALAKLDHPNVVRVFEADEYEHGIYVVMEFIRGLTIERWREEQQPSWERILTVYGQAASGLAAAHEAGLVHRDFKHENVLVDTKGTARVVDFGLVKRTGEATSEATSSLELRLKKSAPSNLTAQGTVMGTPLYLAPEQLRRGESTAKSDQFSFCVALFRSLYGAFPFEGATPVERTVAMAEGRLVDRPADSPVPDGVHAAIVRGLAADPRDRFPTLTALMDAVERGKVGVDKARTWPIALAILVLVVGVVVAMLAR